MTVGKQLGAICRAVLVVTAVVTAAAAFAQSPPAGLQPAPTGIDYHFLNSDWNGLYELCREQVALGREIQADRPVDLSALSSSDALVLVYPTSDLPVDEIMAFVADGGRLLLADDFGSGAELASALGVARRAGPLPHSTYLRGNWALPLVSVGGRHELLGGVQRLVANHAVTLVTPAGSARPVVPYDDSAQRPGWEVGLVLDLRVGEGRAIVLGDPSILINFMLDVADNRAFVGNVFDALCRDRSACRLHLVTDDTPVFGVYPNRRPEPGRSLADRAGETFGESFARVNALLAAVVERRPQPRGVFFAAFFLGLGICVFLFSVIPLRRPKWLSFALGIPGRVRSRSEFEWNLERLNRARRGEDFGLPLAILKDEFEDLFLGALAQHDGELQPERRYEDEQQERFAWRFARRVVPGESRARPRPDDRETDPSDLPEAHQRRPNVVDRLRRRRAAARALATLRAFALIPSRNNLVPHVDERYSERLLRRLYREAREHLRALDLWEDYERRTGRP